MKRAVIGLAALVLAIGLAACGGGSPSSTPSAGGGSNGSSSVADPCYITLAGEVTEYVAVLMANGQSCSTIAFAMQQEFYGATVSSDGSAKPWGSGWGVACSGTLTADDDPSTVVAQGDDTGGVCSTLGFSASP
jgi:hypothetical protein